MQCTSCGTPIPPGAKHCPSCGMPAYDPGTYQETIHSSPNHSIEPVNPAGSYPPGIFQETSSSQASPPSDRTVPAANFQSGARSTPPPDIYLPSPYASTKQQQQLYIPAQQPFSPYEPTQQIYAPAQQPPPPYEPHQQQPQLRYVAPPPTYNQQPFSTPPAARTGRRLSRGFMILLVLLALLIMFSGFGLIYY